MTEGNDRGNPDKGAGESHSPFRVLFVCTGNTCRSPMAEGILRHLVAENPPPEGAIVSASAGTMDLGGAPASDFSIAVCANYGIDISLHRSRVITPSMLAEADLILALSSEHYEECRQKGAAPGSLYMLLGYPNDSGNRVADSVSDPIGGSRRQYEEVFFQIDEALRQSLPSIKAAAAEKVRAHQAGGDIS